MIKADDDMMTRVDGSGDGSDDGSGDLVHVEQCPKREHNEKDDEKEEKHANESADIATNFGPHLTNETNVEKFEQHFEYERANTGQIVGSKKGAANASIDYERLFENQSNLTEYELYNCARRMR